MAFILSLKISWISLASADDLAHEIKFRREKKKETRHHSEALSREKALIFW